MIAKVESSPRSGEGLGMSKRWLGVAVSGDKAVVVDLDVPEGDDAITVVADFTIKLQKGARPDAYAAIAHEISDYAREKDIERAVVKGSAVSQKGRPTLAHFEAAELRGAVIAALASVCPTETLTKANISRNFGDRKVDEYVDDDSFWTDHFDGNLRAGSREAAFGVLAKCRK